MERGGCGFVVKVRNAQNIGASAVVFIDNEENNDVTKIIMIDDGTAGKVFIPAFMIRRKDGEKIKDRVLEDTEKGATYSVALTLTFDLPHPDNRVEYDM